MRAEAEVASTAPPVKVDRKNTRMRGLEIVLVVTLAAATFVVHDVGYALGQPFWTDEAWVAVTVRYPITDLITVNSSTPIGWSLLIRPLAAIGDQQPRLLALLFAAGAVIVAFQFAKGLGWSDPRSAFLTGTLASVAALLVPAMLVRNDLKQYTADACLSLAVLAMTSRLERSWSRGRLTVLATTVVGGMLVSQTTAFVGAAALTSLLFITVIRRSWREAVEAAVTMVASVVGMLVVYEAFDARAVVPGLTAYWRPYYLQLGDGLSTNWEVISRHLHGLWPFFGLGPSWLVAVLALNGIVALFRLRRPATGLTVLILMPEALALAAVSKYPLSDLRTSTYLVVVIVVVAATGIGSICAMIGHWNLWASVLVSCVAAAAFGVGARSDVRVHSIPDEDVRSQVAHVLAYRSSTDVILVNLNSNWGFGYYWPEGPLGHAPTEVVLQGYTVEFPSQPNVVVAAGRDDASVEVALQRALTAAKAASAARIWLVRVHVSRTEAAAWSHAIAAMRLTARQVLPAGLVEIAVT